MIKDNSKYNVIIIGSGFAGIVAADILAEHDLSILLIDENIHIGGQLLRKIPEELGEYSKYNPEKIKKIGDAEFEMADGEEIRIPMSPIRIKIKPKDGYKDIDNLRTKLRAKGLDVERFSKEELLFVNCFGKPKSGILPYVKFGAYNNEFLSAAYSALRLATAKRLLS